jgi:RNA polymerase sigma-70 factor (TIGR02957 family)
MTDLATAHDELRPLMFSIAYRMLGSVAEAEDVVQDAFLNMHRSTLDGTVIESVDAFAATVTTRLAIDALRSARHRREQYVGPWLPEPLVESPESDPAWQLGMDETVSIAFLAVLERLSPTERAVFLLREVFGYAYAEVAAIIGKSEQNCRQLLSRARHSIDAARPRFEPSAEQRSTLATAFFSAVQGDDLEGLERLLADDVAFYGDGGGKAPAIRTPMRGLTQVARFLLGLNRQADRAGVTVEPVQTNGQPGARFLSRDGSLLGVMSLEIADGRVRSITNQINPDKLQHLGRVGDLAALMQQAGRGQEGAGR